MEKEIVEEEIDLREYLDVIWKNRLLILALMLASLTAAGYYSFFILQDEYQTDAVIYLKKLPADFNNFELYSNSAFIIPAMTSNEVISKTVEQSGLADAFMNSKIPKEAAASWLKENIRITQNKNNVNLLNLQLRGSLEPELMQKTLNIYINVVESENRKRLAQDVEVEKRRIDLITSSLTEQRVKILLALEKTLVDNSSERVVMLENFMYQNLRLNAIDERLNTLQMTRMNLEFIESPDFDMIEVISSPGQPDTPVGPSRGTNIAIAGILGLFIGIIAAFFKNYLEGSRSG